MKKSEQEKTPYVDALKKYLKGKYTGFDVPGHHQKPLHTELSKLYTSRIYKYDVNAPRGLDNYMNPTSVIKEAQDLWADFTEAKRARFLVNGSTSGILIMLLSCLKADDKIILPRNVHKSVINGLVLSGASPVFIMPEIDLCTEIVNQISFENWKKAIDENLDAKAIFIINPTYFGATCDLEKIVKYAHLKNMLVLVDEAHGTHFYFNDKMPISAIKAGADMSTLSVHKSGGSLTQSSVLLINNDNITDYMVSKSVNLITTTSPNNTLIASLDAARKFMVFNGEKILDKILDIAKFAQSEISKIRGFKVRAREHFLKNGAYDFDETKLVIEIDKLKLNGFDIYNILKDKYKIQIELAETYLFLCILSIGTTKKDIIKLVKALKSISSKYYDENIKYEDHHYFKSFPTSYCRPRTAFHAPLKVVNYKDALNEVSKEMIMIYPPGIPIIIPGERFSKEVIDQLEYYEKINTKVISDHKDGKVSVIDFENWDNNEDKK